MTASWTIDGVKEALEAKKISARELAADFYKRIETRNPELNAFLTLSPERARRQAAAAAGGRAGGRQGCHQYPRDKDDVWFEDFAELYSAVRCDCGGAAGGR